MLRSSLSSPSLRRISPSQFAFEQDDDDEDWDEEEDEEDGTAKKAAPAAFVELPDVDELNEMKVADLAAMCKRLGQRHTGGKPAIVERLKLVKLKQAMGISYNECEVRKG